MHTRTDNGTGRTVPDVLLACARQRPDSFALMDPGGLSLTSAQLLEFTRRGAGLLAARGVRRGAHVIVDATSMSWNETALAYFSVGWLGAVAVVTGGDNFVRMAAERFGATTLITDGDAAGVVPEVLASADLVTSAGLAGPSPAQPQDLLDVVFTSGTTGDPKPVASTHAQWTRSVRPELLAGRSERVVAHTGVPITVSGGLHGITLNHVARGVSSLHVGSVAVLIGAADQYGVSELHMSPHTGRSLVRQLAPGAQWASRIRVIRLVGGPVPAVVGDGLAERFPQARVVSLYGLTEGGAALCVKRLGEQRVADSIGRPAPGTEVRVLDTDGVVVPAGEVGEIAIRATGAESAGGPDEPAEPGPWARTGDMGYVDSEGTVRLVGRANDLIFLRGGRLSPEAIEERLSRLVPESVDYAVVGMRNEGDWDRIAVFLAGGDHEQVAAAERGLASMKGPFRPHLVTVTERIPRGPFGKPLRRLLLRELGAERG